MKQDRNGTIYNTETATQIARTVRGQYCRETLYKTVEGNYFVHREEWFHEQYITADQEVEPIKSLIRIQSEEAALSWCQRNRISERVIITEFGHRLEASDPY